MTPALGWFLTGVFLMAIVAIAVDWIFNSGESRSEPSAERTPTLAVVEASPARETPTATIIPLHAPVSLAEAA